ncbi:hypothetical protein ACFLYE_03410 [Chloroflexota bacterium]
MTSIRLSKIKVVAVAGLLLVSVLGGSCASMPTFDSHLRSIVKPYRFSIAQWETRTILQQAGQFIGDRKDEINDRKDEVARYFSLVDQISTLKSQIAAVNNGNESGDSASQEIELNRQQQRREALTGTVENIIQEQIAETLAEQGIFHPLDKYIGLKVNFPPVDFKLEKPPHLLVISPRERIETIRTILVREDITLRETEDIEAQADELDVSSLVVDLGGLGAIYPVLVTNAANRQFVLDTAVHEWLHQYLVFKPLGFLYLLDLTGIARNYEIAMMNETLADMVGKEISAIISEKYYPEQENDTRKKGNTEPVFNFDQEMREIRKTVEQYLAGGEIEQAEEFMEQKRQFLATKGYHVRKLNQAYFAFHGKYADRPAFISPIGLELKELRTQSTSLRDFLNTAAALTSPQDLQIAVSAAAPK